MYNDIKRNAAVPAAHKGRPPLNRFESQVNLVYNGGCEEYEDLADYLPRLRVVKGRVIS